MSEYGSYSGKIFDQCDLNSIRGSADYEGEYIDFNHNFTFNMGRIQNSDYQSYYYFEKDPYKDTDCTVKAQELQKNVQTNEKKMRRIETSAWERSKYLSAMKGSAYETMQLNINFKTRFCQFIRQLVDLKLLDKKEQELFEQYKSDSPSFKSLISFLNSPKNLQTKNRLKELMQSSQIVRAIFQSDIKMGNKLTMVKFLQVMKTAVTNKNSGQKWK